ncbi:MAG: DUF1583 domain-containing protein, partial [Rhodopirellula sp.]|nr:DUF1583 domain-containing protein [Rhodopirellula sp.]
MSNLSARTNNDDRLSDRPDIDVRNIIVEGLLMPAGVAAFLVVSAALMNPVPLFANDQLALSAIFAEQHVENTALDVHQHAMQLPAEERYPFLLDWVLPNGDHDTLRMQYAFAPTDPAPVTSAQAIENFPLETGVPSLEPRSSNSRTRLQSGGNIVSPVFDLVDVAKALGQLDDVHDRMIGWAANDQTDAAFHQAAMLTLIELAHQRDAAASARLDEFLRLKPIKTSDSSEPTSAELLVLGRCLDCSSTREAVTDALHAYLPWMRAEWFRTPPKRHVAAMLGRVRAYEITATEDPATPISTKPMQQWSAASRTTAATRGPGCPQARWDFRPGHVENIASHDDDYLYFNTPLRGNFEVEGDVSGFGWRDSHLMVGGTWVAPVYTHAGYDVGNFHTSLPRVEFSPPLTKTKDWIHYRVVSRDQVVSTYFNGRLVREERVSPDHDPWIAIRSPPRQDGAVRNLRIIGQPIIPEEVRLSVDANFRGWLSYYDRPVGGQNGDWQQVGGTDNGGEIIGARSSRPGNFLNSLLKAFNSPPPKNDPDTELPAYRERLLRYHRPMVEDGTIDYEFFYSPGDILTHPALDRLTFLLTPDGVKVHWVTDGKYERSELSPANVFDEPDNRRGPQQLPLKAGDWNRLQLQLNGDTVTLVLNGQSIYERVLEPTNQRTFGLFHFADETQARVRNIVWKGDWPRELPTLAEQELAIDDTGFLDRDAAQLTAVFEHDFAKAGLPLEQFAILRGDSQAHIRHVENGVLATRPGTGGYRNATIAPRLRIHGDFDVTATYRDFESTAVENGHGNLMLISLLDNATADESSIIKRHKHQANDLHEHVAQCLQVGRQVEGERREYFGTIPMEETSGRLRLSRRGNQMYFMTAEGDSPHFQLLAQRETATDDIQLEGLRLLAQIYQEGGEVSVVWSQLLVKAEELSGRAVEDFDSQLIQLNKKRDQLKSKFSWDFAKQAPPETLLRQWTDLSPWKADNGGLLIVAPGTDNWTSAGASVMKTVTGDFDVAVTFDVLKFDIPKPGQRCSVYFQIQLPDKDETQISVIFTNNETGRTEVVAQVREPRGQDKYNYR